MTHAERMDQFEKELVALRLEGERLRNDLTRNMNALTLKVDIVASELKEGQQQLKEGQQELNASLKQLTGTVEILAIFIKEVASLQIDQDGRIRRLESQRPPNA